MAVYSNVANLEQLFPERMKRQAMAVLGPNMVFHSNDFVAVVDTTTPNADIYNNGSTGRIVFSETGDSIMRLGTGAVAGQLCVIDGRSASTHIPVLSVRNRKWFIGFRARTPLPGVFGAGTTISLGAFGAATPVTFGLGIHGSVSASVWRLWIANGGAFTVASSVASSKTTADTTTFSDIYLYNDGTRLWGSVAGEAPFQGPLSSALPDEKGNWRMLNYLQSGAHDDVVDIRNYCWAVEEP